VRWLTGLGLTLCLAFLLGCANDRIGATFDPLAVFPARAKWAWNDKANTLPADERLARLNLDSIVRDTARDAFAAKGYREAAPGESVDYYLNYEVGIGRVISPSSARAVGSVSYAFTEADSGRRVWLGFVRVDVDMSLTEAQRRTRLAAEVAELLKEFPPSQPKQ